MNSGISGDPVDVELFGIFDLLLGGVLVTFVVCIVKVVFWWQKVFVVSEIWLVVHFYL